MLNGVQVPEVLSQLGGAVSRSCVGQFAGRKVRWLRVGASGIALVVTLIVAAILWARMGSKNREERAGGADPDSGKHASLEPTERIRGDGAEPSFRDKGKKSACGVSTGSRVGGSSGASSARPSTFDSSGEGQGSSADPIAGSRDAEDIEALEAAAQGRQSGAIDYNYKWMATTLQMEYDSRDLGLPEITTHIKDVMFAGSTEQRGNLLLALREIRKYGSEFLDTEKLSPVEVSELVAVSTFILVEEASLHKDYYDDTIATLRDGLLGNPAIAHAVFCDPELAFVMIPYDKKLTQVATSLAGVPVEGNHTWEQSEVSWDSVRGMGGYAVELYDQEYHACLFSEENMVGNRDYTEQILKYTHYPHRFLLLHEGAHLLHQKVFDKLTMRDLLADDVTSSNRLKHALEITRNQKLESFRNAEFGLSDAENNFSSLEVKEMLANEGERVFDLTLAELIERAYRVIHNVGLKEPRAYIYPDGKFGCYASENELEFFAEYVNMRTRCQLSEDYSLAVSEEKRAERLTCQKEVSAEGISQVGTVKNRALVTFAHRLMEVVVDNVTSRKEFQSLNSDTPCGEPNPGFVLDPEKSPANS